MQLPPATPSMRPFLCHLTLATVIFMAASVKADQTYGHSPRSEQDPGFFQRASTNVGGFFRRIFKTDEQPPPPPPTAPTRQRNRTRSGPRYNLDQAPGEIRDTPPPVPNRNSPANTTATTPKTASTTKSKSTATTSSRDIPPTPEPAKPKTPKVTASTNTSHKTVSGEIPPKPKTPRQPETTTTADDHGGVLYSNKGTTTAKQPETPANTDSSVIPTPPKVPAESSSVLTGSKTGKLGRVKSPYAPYSELDVTGLPSGSLALDPTTQKVFRIP